jgi:hypothetical protein
MVRNLDFDNCTTEAVLAAYEQELAENERRICDEGAWAISLEHVENHVLVSHSDEILPEPSADSGLEMGPRTLQDAERLCRFLLLQLGLKLLHAQEAMEHERHPTAKSGAI